MARAAESISARGSFSVALAGGNTPRGVYELLAEEPYRGAVDWSKVHVYWGDERYIPPTDESSNERMARETLLSKVPVEESHVHPMYAPGGPEGAAESYETILRTHFQGSANGFDLILSGMGPDGHTASLFPSTIADAVNDPRWVLPTHSPIGIGDRITLNVPVLTGAGTLLFLAAGADKAETLAAVFSDALPILPAAIVSRRAAQAIWFVDDAAAASLPASAIS